jgi:cytochrome c biogenesis protein CcdA
MKHDQRKNDLKTSLLFFAFGAVAVLFFFGISESATGELFRSVGNSWYLLVIGGGLIIASLVRLFGAFFEKTEEGEGEAFRCPHCREIIPIVNVPIDGSGFACPHCGEWIG